MILRDRLPPDYRRRFNRALIALARGAERLAQTARRWSREEPPPRTGGGESAFAFAVLAIVSGSTIVSDLALIAFAPR